MHGNGRLISGLLALATWTPPAQAQFALFTLDVESASGRIRGQDFAGVPLRFTFLLDTQTGTAVFGGGDGSTLYSDVAASAWLDVSGDHLVRHGQGVMLLTQDEGFDYLSADILGLRVTFWRNATDGPFTDPGFERPLGTVLVPGKYLPLLFHPGFGDPLPNRITGTFSSPEGEVMLTEADIQSLSLALVPAPGSGAVALVAISAAGLRRRRR